MVVVTPVLDCVITICVEEGLSIVRASELPNSSKKASLKMELFVPKYVKIMSSPEKLQTGEMFEKTQSMPAG